MTFTAPPTDRTTPITTLSPAHIPASNGLPGAVTRARGSQSEQPVVFNRLWRQRAGSGGSGAEVDTDTEPEPRSVAMRAAKTPTPPQAKQRPRRIPLQELRLQPGAEGTSLTPLFRRLRLKDHDRATPVPCTRDLPVSVTSVPCAPGPRRSAVLLPTSSTALVTCTWGPRSRSTIPEPSGTPAMGLSTSETPRSPTLVPGAPQTPGNPTMVPCTPEPPSSPVPAPLCSPIPGPSTPEPPSSPVPAPSGHRHQRHPRAHRSGWHQRHPRAPWQAQRHPAAVAGTSVTPVPTAVAGTSVTPVPTAVAGTSVTPVPTTVAGTSVTPVLTTVTGTFMTPRDLHERSANASTRGLPCAKDNAAETDSLLWHCPREQLKSLPRAELEGRLESTLIIIEALSLQLRNCQESHRLLPGVGPAEQRDAFTQMDVTHSDGEEEIYRNLYLELRRKTETLQRQREVEQDLHQELELTMAGMSTWIRLFRGLVDAAFQSLQDEQGALDQEQEQVRALVSQCRAVLESVPSKLRSCLEERDAMRQQANEALRAKEQSDCFLEAFRAHANAQISARDQSLTFQQELCMLLADAINQQASLTAESKRFREFIDVTFENLEKERRALDTEREQARALVSRCWAVLENVPKKLQSCLEERDAARRQADQALQAKEEASCKLEETSMALQDAVTQLEELTVANSRLSTDLSSLMTNLATVEQERDVLQQENEKQWEEMAWLARERESLQQECKGLFQELHEATECREFLDQESRTCRTQLLEVEAKLKSTLDTLQESGLQNQELMDSHQRLREEHAALGQELETTKAELLDLQLKRDKVSWCSADIAESKLRLQELADCLRAALQEEDDDAPSRSRVWTPAPRTLGWRTPGWQTPHRAWTPACRTPGSRTPYCASSSFVGSVLKAVSGKDANEVTGGGSTFTKDKPASSLKPTEPEEGLLESVKELRAVVSDLVMLSSRIQDLEQGEFKALQTKISDLQLRLETVTAESQEKMDTQAATIAKLNKALRGKLENEKELQDVVKRQEEKMLQLIDQSGEVTRLKGEVSQLKRSLQRAETEAKVLWEEMREQKSMMDVTYVQERVLLRQELDKLRLLLLEKEDENQLLSDKYSEQVRGLELRLCHTQKVLKTREEMLEKIREVLLAVPEGTVGCQELHSLLKYLGLKPSGGSKDVAEPL
ncbi:sperm-associated antigen 5 [Calypte anna]|nr:sperm-associated antigen 5 [Calypte anna]